MHTRDESKRISDVFQLSFQVIHHTRPGLNSPILSSDKVLKVSHSFTFTTVGEVKYPKNLQNIRKKTPKDSGSEKHCLTGGKISRQRMKQLIFLPSHTCTSSGASAADHPAAPSRCWAPWTDPPPVCTLSAAALEETAQGEMLLYAERTVTLSLPVYLISQRPWRLHNKWNYLKKSLASIINDVVLSITSQCTRCDTWSIKTAHHSFNKGNVCGFKSMCSTC